MTSIYFLSIDSFFDRVFYPDFESVTIQCFTVFDKQKRSKNFVINVNHPLTM